MRKPPKRKYLAKYLCRLNGSIILFYKVKDIIYRFISVKGTGEATEQLVEVDSVPGSIKGFEEIKLNAK